MAKKKADLEKELEMWRETADEQAERLRELAKRDDDLFAASHLKEAMEREIAWLKKTEQWSREARQTTEREMSGLKKSISKILEDNQRLCAEQSVSYKVGLTESWEKELPAHERRVLLENKRLKRENTGLEGEIRERDDYIAYLKDILRDRLYDKAEGYIPSSETREKSKKRGRPTITDDTTKRRIRKMKRDGFSVRRIAEMEKVSPATVQKIVKKR